MEEILASLQQERNVLASIIQSQEAWLRVSDKLTEEDFTNPINQALWQIVDEMWESGVKPSPVSINDKLPTEIKKQVDELGGWEYISTLEKIPVEPLSVEHPAKELKNLTILRRGRAAGDQIKSFAEKTDSSETFLEKVEEIVNEIPGVVGTEVTLLGSIVEDYIAEKRANPKKIPGLSTGYPIFDSIVQGLQPGRLYILGARTGVGKSIWCLNLVKSLAIDQDIPVLYISTEQTQRDEISRLVSIVAEVPEHYINNGTFIQANDFPERVDEAQDKIKGAPIFFSHDPMFSPEKLYRTIKKYVLIEKVQAVFFDYIRIPVNKVGSSDKWALVGDLAYGLKAIASDLNVPIISAVQVNRDGSEAFKATGEMDGSYFALSDMIEQASSVAAVLRPLNKTEREENPDYESKRILTFSKNRHGSKNTKLLFTIDQSFVKLTELRAIGND